MIYELHCDGDECAQRWPVPSNGMDYVTQHTAATFARELGWLVMHGARRDYHYCPRHRSSAAIVLRFAAAEVSGSPRGIHAALRELGVDALADTAKAAWRDFYIVARAAALKLRPPLSHRAALLAAARIAEAGA